MHGSEINKMIEVKNSAAPTTPVHQTGTGNDGNDSTRPIEMVSLEDKTINLRNTTNDVAKSPKKVGVQNTSAKDNTNITPKTTTTTTATTIISTSAASTIDATNRKDIEWSEVPLAINYIASFHQICVISALLPLVTLFACFVTAYVFQYDDVHETHCRVYNIVPSISAITGVSPQRYFWRMAIAFHIGPRLPIAFVYKNYYHSKLDSLHQRAPHQVPMTSLMITAILVLNCIEIVSLGGVSYISNRENYPMHEKIFITFMICSLVHMLLTIKLHAILHDDLENLMHTQRQSIKWKKILFAISILSTIGLLFFFAKHRFYCHDLAFSWFAFFEYCIAIANMLFHFTIIWDFPSQFLILAQGSHESLQRLFKSSIKRD